MSRIVIKVGTSTLVHPGGRLNIRHMEKFVKILSDLKNAGNEIILVSSGAIAMGVGKLNLTEKPNDTTSKQACAAIGQCELMYIYDKLFEEYNHSVAQLLITREDLENETRRTSFQETLFRLLEYGALPIINENDTMAIAEILSIGDNDTLSSYVATNIQADLLILCSDIDGLYTSDPRTNKDATLIHEVHHIDESVKSLASGAGSSLGTGGMITKIHAAEICNEKGVDMIILNGAKPELLYDVVEGKAVGTRFYGKNV